ncbi:MAG: ATP-binding cassette domain-containing protein [Planctomycetota bacterium]
MTVTVTGVSKAFGAVRALDDVSFACAPGEVLGILGPNGAGKTTILRIIATLLVPDTGTVDVAGIRTDRDPAGVRRRVGYISGDTGLYERLTPREMAVFFGRLNGLEGAGLRARIGLIFDLFGITPFADRPCGELSQGMRQKVSLARAVVHDPAVLILDEPTAHLDVIAARAVTDFIAAVRAAGTTVLYAGHNMDEAQRVCTHAIMIDRGRVIGRGAMADLAGGNGLNARFFALMAEAGRTTPAEVGA